MDIKVLLEGIEKLLGYMFGGEPPEWLLPLVAWGIALGFLLQGLIFVLGQMQKIWTEFILPVYYKPEEKRRAVRRHIFADFIESEIRRLNALEAWNDNRFAELEAEVEAEGRKKLFDFLKIGGASGSNLRKEKSLSKALGRSSERLILVEGDPGSGKSVALRHLAQRMAQRANTSRSLKSIIPLYVNLKHLRRSADQPVDQKLIHEFVFKNLNRINDRDVEEFLTDEFKQGMADGTWLFLFDSFDEIPDILSSTEADHTIREYADAISAFLHGMNQCRGVVASREYKGPRFLGWPKFRILPLSLDRKIELIRRTGLKLEIQKNIIDGISQSATDFRYLTGNPMFLNLLCEFMNKKSIPEFPRHTHLVFNDYVWKRLEHDEERLRKRFAKSPGEIREAAEKLAFCMTADTGIGLSPTLEQLETATKRLGLELGSEFSNFVNAIEYLKLARIETSIQDGSRYFTFSHRRFQEYFATAVVLREPERMSASALLTDARWRETTVVILQTQSLETITPLFAEIHSLLTKCAAEFQKDNPLETGPEKSTVSLPSYGLGKLGKNLFERFAVSRKKIEAFINTTELVIDASDEEAKISLPLNWPRNLFHILGILQEGLSTKYELMPENTRQVIDTLLITMMRKGSLDDRKWALDVAGCASIEVVEQAIDIGFSSPGTWVKNSAVLQVSRLSHIPDKFSQHIVSNLLMSAQEELLIRRRYEIYAQFSRFSNENYRHVASLIVWMPVVDFFLSLVSTMLVFGVIRSVGSSFFQVLSLSVVLFFTIAGFLIRWRSSSILKMIADTYSARFIGNYSRYSDWFFKRFRVKQPKRPNKRLSEKLMSLVMGLIFSLGGVLLFVSVVITAKLYAINDYVWIILVIFSSFQLWSLMATLETFQIKRASFAWRLLYFFYPVGASFVFPIVVILYLLDQFYLISRAGLLVSVLKTSRIRNKFIPFLYRGNYYSELWMPVSLAIVVTLSLGVISLAANAAISLVVVLMFFEIAVMVYLFLMPAIVILKERSEYHIAKRNLKRMDMLSFVSIVEQLKTKRYRLSLIFTVLDKQYIIPSDENLKRLRLLISFIQMVLSSEYTAQNFKYLVSIDQDLAKALGYIDQDTCQTINYWDEDQLDTFCKLLEQLQKTTIRSG